MHGHSNPQRLVGESNGGGGPVVFHPIMPDQQLVNGMMYTAPNQGTSAMSHPTSRNNPETMSAGGENIVSLQIAEYLFLICSGPSVAHLCAVPVHLLAPCTCLSTLFGSTIALLICACLNALGLVYPGQSYVYPAYAGMHPGQSPMGNEENLEGGNGYRAIAPGDSRQTPYVITR